MIASILRADDGQEYAVVEAPADPILTFPFDAETKTMTVGFDDLYVVTTEGVDVFALNLNTWVGAPPFYLLIDGREFALQPSHTYLVTGHGAQMPLWVRTEEAEGRLTVLAERDGRYLVYSHDTTVIADAEEADEDAPAAAE